MFWQSDIDVDEEFSLLQPLDLITKDVNELQEIIRERKRKKYQHEQDKDKEKDRERTLGGEKEKERHDRDQERDKEKMEKDKEQEKDREKDKQHGERKDKARLDENGAGGKETCKKLKTYFLFFVACRLPILDKQHIPFSVFL